jgi:error-prone DNA polymerase
MGWRNPPVPWSELERRLSDRGPARSNPGGEAWPNADGGDSPAWSRKRQPYEAPERFTTTGGSSTRVNYAELHCHSNFSFLDGVSSPEALAEEATRLGLSALAVTDHDGFYGVVRFAEAARELGLPTIFGSELTLDLPPAEDASGKRRRPLHHSPDPAGSHLVVLARDPIGYGRLATAISEAQLRGAKGAPSCTLEQLAEVAHRDEAGDDPHWFVLTGCRKGRVPNALVADGPAAATRELGRLVGAFGREHVAIELWDHGDPLDSARNDALVELAMRAGVEVVATNNVHYASPADRRLATAVAAVRARRSLDELDGWLPAAASAHLRSGDEQARRFARAGGRAGIRLRVRLAPRRSGATAVSLSAGPHRDVLVA